MRILLVLLLSVGIQKLAAQPLDSSSFDFWVGEWKLSWQTPKGETKTGYNRIEKILDGKVIQENFADSASGFFGKSWSTWNPRTKEWRQVWTDNQGSFLEFTGQRYGDTLAFAMKPAMVHGEMLVRRMIFYNITEDSFTWDWQSAPEESEEWKVNWRIWYERER